MKIKIKYRLFCAILAATGVVVISMFLIMQWSVGRGFLAYVNTMEKDRLQRLVLVLERSYDSNGSWEFIRDNPEIWPELLASTREGREGRESGEADSMKRRMGRRGLRSGACPGRRRRRGRSSADRAGCRRR